MEEKLELEDLEGEHEVSGVDFDIVSFYDSDESNRMTIVIDGIPLGFIEDPNDGWRSTFGEVQVGKPDILNMFEPIKLNFTYTREYEENRLGVYEGIIAYFEDKEVLKIGTDNSDDYYPVCVLEWNPTSL